MYSATTTADASQPWELRLSAFPPHQISIGELGSISYRMAKPAKQNEQEAYPLVLLHGIGSGAASWVQLLETLCTKRAVYAWDAPGYGLSTESAQFSPNAHDYAQALIAWLDALNLQRVILAGHSLGAIMAGSAAVAAPNRIAAMLLLSPAAGYGNAPIEVRNEKRDSRLALLNQLGPAGLAEKRSASMLSSHASADAFEWVRWNMARIRPTGYAKATLLLANTDLVGLIKDFHGSINVSVGADDVITPPSACQLIAQAAKTDLKIIPRAGHIGYIEQPQAYIDLIEQFCTEIDQRLK
jgi:pimeloyl-ACP methyl ester carboxylesterase